MVIQRIIRSWQGLNPQTRRSIRRTSGLVALVTSAAVAAWFLWPSGNNTYFSRNRDNVVMGEKYALQRVNGYEFIRPINSDGSLGEVYDIPRGPHLDLYPKYNKQDHVHKEKPGAVVFVFDVDTGKGRIISQPGTLPYKP